MRLRVLLASCLAGLLCDSALGVPGPPVAATERARDRPTLVVGIDQAFPPFEWDASGTPRGFGVDMARAVARATGHEVRFVSGPWHEILERLMAGEIDLTPTMAYRRQREDRLDFSVAVVGAEYTAFVPDHSPVALPRDLIGRRVLVQRDGYLHDVLHDWQPELQVATAASPLGALRALVAGRADGALLLQAQGLYLLREEGIEGVRSLGTPVAHLAYRMAVPEGRVEQLALLNDGILAVRTSGRYDEIYDHWFGVVGPVPPDARGLVRVAAALGGLVLVGLALATAWSLLLRRRVEAALREQQSLSHQLYQAQELEALGRLAQSVAHDFNNYLTVILGNLRLARAETGTTPHAEALLEEATRAAGSAGDLVGQLLSFARGQQGAPRELAWSEVLEQLEPILRRLAPERIVIAFHDEKPSPRFHMCPSQATQVLMNLVTNAYEAIAGSGVVSVRIGRRAEAGRELVCLAVQDDGVGMDEATRARVFEPFFTTKGNGGAGLGLAGVDRIVREAGGRIEVTSARGEGTTFRVLLPCADGTPAA